MLACLHLMHKLIVTQRICFTQTQTAQPARAQPTSPICMVASGAAAMPTQLRASHSQCSGAISFTSSPLTGPTAAHAMPSSVAPRGRLTTGWARKDDHSDRHRCSQRGWLPAMQARSHNSHSSGSGSNCKPLHHRITAVSTAGMWPTHSFLHQPAKFRSTCLGKSTLIVRAVPIAVSTKARLQCKRHQVPSTWKEADLSQPYLQFPALRHVLLPAAVASLSGRTTPAAPHWHCAAAPDSCCG